MVRSISWRRFGLPMVAAASLISAALADFLFYDEVIGWTLGGFVAWLALLVLLRNGRALVVGRRCVWGWSLLILISGLAVSLVIEPGAIAVVLSAIMLCSLAMLAHGWSNRTLGWRWLWAMVLSWAMAIVRPVCDNRIARRWLGRTRTLRSRINGVARLIGVLIGIAIPLILSLIFLGLFALANPVVSNWMSTGTEKIGDFFLNLSDYLTVSRVALWYAAAFACWGLLRHRPKRSSRLMRLNPNTIGPATEKTAAVAHDTESQSQEISSDPVAAAANKKRAEQGESTQGAAHRSDARNEAQRTTGQDVWAWLADKYARLVVRCLVAMNLVFALQLTLDSRYLVLGSELPDGMGYAEYAQRGAYPLIATAILAAALVLAVFRPGGIAQRSKLAVWLVLLWIAQNIALVISAAWRLQAYVEVYTLTRLRVSAAVWMLMVAGCLVLLLWRIARSRDNAWLTAWAMGWGIAVLWVCSFVPFDPLIASYNVRNCKEMGGQAGAIDLAYLESLGPDALPAVAYLIDHLPSESAESPARPAAQRLRERGGGRVDPRGGEVSGEVVSVPVKSVGQELASLQTRLRGSLDEQLEGWRGWTVRRAWLSDPIRAD